MRNVVSVDDILCGWVIGTDMEFGVVIDVEFICGWFIIIWDIVNDIGFHFFKYNA